MKTQVQLWVRLKVIDLVTQTARITLAEKLNFAGTLRGMTHYWYWGMEAEGVDATSVLAEIDRVIRLDSAFTNQNKHLYRLTAGAGLVTGDLALEKDFQVPAVPSPAPAADAAKGPSRGTASTGAGALKGAVAGTAGTGAGTLKGAVAGTAGTGLFAFDCLVRERRRDRESGFAERLNARLKGAKVSNMKYGEVWRLIVGAPSEKAALGEVEKMLVSRSRREGLLLNPHYQEYEIIATTRVGADNPATGERSKG